MVGADSFASKALAAWLLVLLAWLPLPLGSTQDGPAGVLVLGCALGLAAYGALLWLAPGTTPVPPRSALWMAGLLLLVQAWAGAQLALGLSADPGQGARALMLGLGYSSLFVMLCALFRERRRLTALLVVLVASGTVQAFYGVFMALSGADGPLARLGYSHGSSASGSYVNRNHLAGYLVMCLGCAVGLLFALRTDSSRALPRLLEALLGPKMRTRLALVIMVIGLVMTHSRMGNTAFVLSLAVTGALFAWYDSRHRVRNLLILASIVVVDLLVVSQYFGLDTLRSRLAETRLEDVVVDGRVVARESEDRDDVVAYALPLAQARPLLGHGAGSFEAVFPAYPGPDVLGHVDHAHNDYLQFWIEYGALASAAAAFFVLLALREALQALRERHSRYRKGLGFGAAMGIVGLMVHALADFNLQIPANAATFVALCAVAVLANRHHHVRRVDYPPVLM
ncbi:hypothetical protein CKCBHOJB_01673 [Thauera sp. GDN1]|uniref:O-antigen ligase family protein n=1 Tax=Thauera sp. GDN1 TaxID=2944810 RepID=UPI0024793CC1|nr:O-antigen ligase family protein [Thauera sp. GDN1]WEN42088.1 hypothetical protein CKCBHOJB_01673 [Thauera sp. GDN1]